MKSIGIEVAEGQDIKAMNRIFNNKIFPILQAKGLESTDLTQLGPKALLCFMKFEEDGLVENQFLSDLIVRVFQLEDHSLEAGSIIVRTHEDIPLEV